jgi:hypothetical protein
MSLLSPNSIIPGVPVGPTPTLGGGNYVPQLSLANFSSKVAHIKVQFAETSGDSPNTYQVQSLAVPPGQTRELILDNLQGDPDLKNSFLIDSDGAPGDVLVKLVSQTSSRTGEAEFLAKDQLDQNNVGTQPWSTQDGTESTLLLFNNSTIPQTFQVHFSGGGVAWHKNYILQPMETQGINIGTLIASKTPDDSGKILPLDTTSGVAIWTMAHHGAGKGRVLQSNATTGMARSFSCNEYGTVAGAEWVTNTSPIPDGTTVYAGEVLAAIDLVVGEACSGTFEDYGNGNGYLFSYSSSNSSIASVTDPTGDQADVEGMADGTATISGTVEDPEYDCEGFAEGTESVVPSLMVDGNGTNSIFVGTDSTITALIGTNTFYTVVSPKGGSFAVTSSDSTDTFTNGSDAGYPVASITTMDQSAKVNDRTLTFEYAVSGQPTAQVVLNVTAREFAYATNPTLGNICPYKYGYEYKIVYTPYTHPDKTAVQPSIGMNGVIVAESFVPPTFTCGNTPGNGTLTSERNFTDTIAVCSTNPIPPCSSTNLQTIKVGGFTVRTNSLTVTNTPPLGYVSNGPTQ